MPLDELELTSLTNLNWDQPLVSSVRLLIASGQIDYGVPADSLGTPSDDASLLQLSKRDFSDFVGPPLIVRHSDGSFEKTIPDFSGAQVRFVHDVQKLFTDPSRANAILAVIFTELGWTVNKISRILQTSRPTLNRWVMTHANHAVTDDEVATIKSAPGYKAQLFLDLRTIPFRAKRSGAVWKKAIMLPPSGITQILGALWRVSYRVRGDRSPADEVYCSYLLDGFVDMLFRRGVTGLNLGKIVNVSHAAVLLRAGRSDDHFNVPLPKGDPDGYNSAFRTVKDAIINDDTELRTDEYFELQTSWTKSHYLDTYPGFGSILMQVRTGSPTERNPIPSPNVSILSVPDDLGREQYRMLDNVPLYGVTRELDKTTEHYRPLSSYASKEDRNEAVDALRHNVDLLGTDDDSVVQMYDAGRFNFPFIAGTDHWKSCEILTECLLGQATAQYDRDANQLGRPGFGETSYHWVPFKEALDLIDISSSDKMHDTLIEFRRKTASSTVDLFEGFSEEYRVEEVNGILSKFMSPMHFATLQSWLRTMQDSNDTKNSLLYDCIYHPGDVIARYPAPRKRS